MFILSNQKNIVLTAGSPRLFAPMILRFAEPSPLGLPPSQVLLDPRSHGLGVIRNVQRQGWPNW